MSLITEGYGEDSSLITFGYGFISELITELTVKIKIVIEMFKKHLSLSHSKIYSLGFQRKEKTMQITGGTTAMEMEIKSQNINIDLQLNKKDIVIDMEEET